ncbi:cell wall hydrolase [Croceicoccus sp. F390]|uniref:Cell wall hydrolase n=1 Tax=Croceicoccus esteveae TaxID=3075597 RepID=A0ABU2ZK40_9SPHN|nr:cell wall hydrolase [Croceicoccus sp. F390]MDT0576965.1 cell wall hydrolase [Croceicoccus sp. F390]
MTHPAMQRALAWVLRPHVALAFILALCCLTGAAGLLLQQSIAYPATPDILPGSANPSGTLATGVPSVDELAPDHVRTLSPQTARTINLQQPVTAIDNPPAASFRLAFAAPAERSRSLDCLSSAVYYEAGMESDAGQRAVAQVVLNRVRHPAYPNSVCAVVYQGAERATGCQFTFTCDGSLARAPSPAGWSRARQIAEQVLAGAVYAPVGYSTNYHADYVVPYWSGSLLKTATIGAHIFYRAPGRSGRPGAFAAQYAGIEPAIGAVIAPVSEQEGPHTMLTAVAPPDTLALPPAPRDVAEDQARALDRFAVLDYKARHDAALPAARTRHDVQVDAAVGLALQQGRRQARSAASTEIGLP